MLLRIETYKILRRVAFAAILSLPYFGVAQNVTVTTGTGGGALMLIINNANAGDTIFVQSGTYNLTASTSAFVLRSGVTVMGIGSAPVIFHLASGDRMFSVSGGTHTTRIENITMTRHTGTNWPTEGGGIILASSTARLEIVNCTIRGGTIGNRGGAIAGNNAHITIRNSLIHNSQAQDGGAFHFTNSTVHIYDSRIGNSGQRGWTGQGGAIWATGSNITMKNTDIDSARAQHGGGLYLVNSTVHISDSRIHTNVTSESGGGFRINGGTMLIDRTNIFNNRVTGGPGGGAGFITGCAEVTVRHSNITNNFAHTRGAAFHVEGGVCTELTLYRSTIAGNYSSTNNWAPGAAGGAISAGDGVTINIRYSIVSGNDSGNEGVDDNVSGDDENLDIDNSVVDDDLIVGNDPNNCFPPAQWIGGRCIVPGAFEPDDIVVDSAGNPTTPPVNAPGGDEIGSGGEQNVVLNLTIAQAMICPTDSIRITVYQTNVTGLQLQQVDSTGQLIRQIGTPFSMTPAHFAIAPEPNVPIKFFRVIGTAGGTQIYSSIESVIIFPTVISHRINHIGNLELVPPLEPTPHTQP